MVRRDAIIIGGGVVGVATAWALARRGLSVTLLEANQGPAMGASFANGAQLSYAYADALASPAMVRRLPLLVLGLDPAFRLRPSLDPDLLRWGLRFLREGSAGRFASNTRAQLELAFESRAALHQLLDRHAIDFGHATPGKLHLYASEAEFATARASMALKERLGARQRAIAPGEIAGVEPALAERAATLAGAILSPAEEVGDPHRFAAGLLDVLRRDYGVQARFGFRVTRLSPGEGEVRLTGGEGEQLAAAQVIVCTGDATPRLLRPIGVRMPIQPIKGYSITAPPGEAPPRLSVTDGARRIVFCRLSGRMRIAGLAELGNHDRRVEPRRLAALVRSARASLPHAADYDRIESSWAGLRPMTPFSRPVIARVKPGLVVNAGHGVLGWTLAMGSAERAAALVTAPAA